MYRGKDVTQSLKKVEKKGGFAEKHSNLQVSHEEIDINDLVPLESQRITKGTWVEQRLIEQGMDWWAFDALGVCRDINDNINYVWNGCGRLAIAQMYANKLGISFKVPCRVVIGTKEEAAYYFAYTQDKGRRTLSKEVLFVNRVFSKMDTEATDEVSKLTFLGLYVKGDSGQSVPTIPENDDYEISYRGFYEALHDKNMANGEIPLMRQARDMIVDAWGNKPGFIKIHQDIFWAMCCFLNVYPEARNNGIYASISNALKSVASAQKDPKKLPLKQKGLSGNSGIAPQLALGLFYALKDTEHWTSYCENKLPVGRLKELI
jgi:hypothetical protein